MDIHNTVQVEALFARFSGLVAVNDEPRPLFMFLDPRDFDAYMADQKRVRTALNAIMRDRPRVPGWIEKLLEKQISAKVVASAHFSIARGIEHTHQVHGVEAAYALGLAYLIQDSDARLRRCTECERYYVVYDQRKRKYCKACAGEMSGLKSAKRQREYRKRKKQKRR